MCGREEDGAGVPVEDVPYATNEGIMNTEPGTGLIPFPEPFDESEWVRCDWCGDRYREGTYSDHSRSHD